MPSRYSGRRRRGISGFLGLMRGEVVDGDGTVVLQARSPALVNVVARLLNGEEVERREVAERSPTPNYQLSHGFPDGRCAVVGIESSARYRPQFGGGILVIASDPALAAEVAKLLNEVDPRHRPRVQRGIGWW